MMVHRFEGWQRSGMRYSLFILALCHLTSSLDFRYHNNEDVANYFTKMSTTYPDLTYLYSIGKTVQNRDLWVLAIGKNLRNHVNLRPHVKYIGNMHGNEVVSREVLLHLIDYYLTNYNTNSTIRTFLDNTGVHILPTMNPDGFNKSMEGDCDGIGGRENANGYDLNRNFPGYFEVNPRPIQPETRAVMDWLKQYRFILSANLHGGAMVANYPFDNYVNGSFILQTRYVRSPDDDTFQYLSRVYSYSHQTMHTGQHCGDRFSEGITNGAWWYPVLGGMQDYNYVREGCFEVTLEISCCKYPNSSHLPWYWAQNKYALINYLMSVHTGVKGLVLTPNETVVPNAEMRIKGRESMTFKTSEHGEYWRLLRPGVYIIQVVSSGDIVAESTVTILNEDVVRQDLYLGKLVNTGNSLKSYLPVTGLILSLCYFVVKYFS